MSLRQMLARFSLVGIGATLTYFVVANLLIATQAMPAEHASLLAYLCGMAVSFAGQSRLTFTIRRPSWRHAARFCIMSVAGLLISWLSVVAVKAAGGQAFWATVFTSIAVPVLSFVTMKMWVFAEPKGDR